MKYKHLAEHEFGLDTNGLLRNELNGYSKRFLEMAKEYGVHKSYIRRTVIYLAFKRVRRGRKINLEKSVDVVERWLRKRKRSEQYWEYFI